MNVYLPINGDIEDLVNTLEALKPGLVTSRQVLEVSTEDKGVAALLKKFGEGTEDEVNAAEPRRAAKKPRQTKKGKTINLKAAAPSDFGEVDETYSDGGEL
jgi:hypothetical protein